MVSQELSPAETEWLSLIRYQLLQARATVEAPSPVNVLAINLMQDVVEAALLAAAEHLSAPVQRKADFAELLATVTAALGQPEELTGRRGALTALNQARVSFKHHGNRLSEASLSRHLNTTEAVVPAIVRLAFQADLAEISLLAFIHDDQVRDLLQQADTARRRGDLPTGIWLLRLAFDLTVREYESRKSIGGWHSIFELRPLGMSHSYGSSSWASLGMSNPFAPLKEWLEALDVRVHLLTVGVDLQRYAYFDAIAPVAVYTLGDNPPIKQTRHEDLTARQVDDSFLFVVDTAIRLAAGDYSLQDASTPDLVRSRYRLPAPATCGRPSEPAPPPHAPLATAATASTASKRGSGTRPTSPGSTGSAQTNADTTPCRRGRSVPPSPAP